MDDFALVLNAGSSSLKFSVYRRPGSSAWRVDARGQIDGIGTSPRFTATDGAGVRIAADQTVNGRDIQAAFDEVGAWLRAR